MKKLGLLFFFTIQTLFIMSEPMFISFKEMVEQSKYIFVGEVTNYPKDGDYFLPGCTVTIHEVLKGDLKNKSIDFSRAATSIYTEIGEIFIGFVDSSNTFTWLAKTPNKGNVKEELLFVEGMYDFNAYLVYPSQITYSLLKEYLDKGSYTINYEGNLNFYDSKKKEIKNSKTYFKVKYTYPSEVSTVETNLKFVDINDTAGVTVGSWDKTISIVYEENLIRPLKFLGEFKSIDMMSNTVSLNFYVSEPFFYDENDFEKYISSPKLGSPFYLVRVNTKETELFAFPVGYSNIDEQGFRKQIKNYFDWSNLSFREEQFIEGTYKGDNYRIDYKSIDLPIPIKSLGFDADIIQSLLMSDWKGTCYKMSDSGNENMLKVTLSLSETLFLENVNYRH